MVPLMTEAGVAHRTIGQRCFGFSRRERPRSTLDEIVALIIGSRSRLAGAALSATKGEQAWPPLEMFRAMLLPVWYDLSDVKLANALEDRGSFRRFCGFSGTEATPERTAFVRFPRLLVAPDLDYALFDAITDQLTRQAITVKAGTIVDATIIASASEDGGDARWAKHRGKRAPHRFKAYVACDADTALVEKIAVTPPTSTMGMPARTRCPIVPARSSPTVLIADRTSAAPSAPGEGRRVSYSTPCGAATRRRRSGACGTATGRSIASVAGLRRSSAPETLVRTATDAMARPTQSRPDPPHRHRLQPQASFQSPRRDCLKKVVSPDVV